MGIDEIAAMPVGQLAAGNSHLWLWTTNAALLAARPVLELFARRTRPGWDVWGNEVDSDVAL
jgi:N6-adenosine-specific RNA methylase IME4